MSSHQEKLQQLKGMFADADMTQSVIGTVLDANKGNVEATIDELLNMCVDPMAEQNDANVVVAPAPVESEQERILRVLEEQKRLEEAHKRRQREALVKAAAEQEARDRLKLLEQQQRAQEQQRCAEQQRKLQAEHERLAQAKAKIEAERQQTAAEAERLRAEEQRLEEELRLQEEVRVRVEEENRLRLENQRMEEEIQALARFKAQHEAAALEAAAKAAETGAPVPEVPAVVESVKPSDPELQINEEEARMERKRKKERSKRRRQKKKADIEDKIRDSHICATEEEIKKIREEMMVVAEQRRPVPPKASIYIRPAQNQSSAEEVAAIKQFLIENGLQPGEIREMDVSNDFELASFLKEVCKGLVTYPLVCVRGKALGNLESLKELAKENKLSALLNAAEDDVDPEDNASDASGSGAPSSPALKDGTGIFYGQGVLDHCLDAAEYVVSGVGSLLWFPVALVTWPFRSSDGGLPAKKASDVDFDVVHTNWYWRNLKRRFRFCDDNFVRLHPRHMDVRATHDYTSVQSVSLVDPKNVVIRYNNNSTPDYICAVPEDCRNIMDIIVTRAKAKNHNVIVDDSNTTEAEEEQ